MNNQQIEQMQREQFNERRAAQQDAIKQNAMSV